MSKVVSTDQIDVALAAHRFDIQQRLVSADHDQALSENGRAFIKRELNAGLRHISRFADELRRIAADTDEANLRKLAEPVWPRGVKVTNVSWGAR